jgi:hypothetical protein
MKKNEMYVLTMIAICGLIFCMSFFQQVFASDHPSNKLATVESFNNEAANMAKGALSAAILELRKPESGMQAAAYCKVFIHYNKLAKMPIPENFTRVKYDSNIRAAKFCNEKAKDAYARGNFLAGDAFIEKSLEYLAEASK